MCNNLTSLFRELAATAEHVEFNPNWANRTGYLDHAVADTTITQVSVTVDSWGRQVVIIPTEASGNVVVFERYIDDHERYAANYRVSALHAPNDASYLDHATGGNAVGNAALMEFLERHVA